MVWIFFTAVAVCYFAISFGIKVSVGLLPKGDPSLMTIRK